MGLNRRIVLEDSEINSPPEPQPITEPERSRGPELDNYREWRRNPFVSGRRANAGIDRPSVLIETPLPDGTYILTEPAQSVTARLVPTPPPGSVLQENGSLNQAALEKAIRQKPELTQYATFNDFFELMGIGLRNTVVECKGCHVAGSFDADFDKQTMRCEACGRTVSFWNFRQEHAG